MHGVRNYGVAHVIAVESGHAWTSPEKNRKNLIKNRFKPLKKGPLCPPCECRAARCARASLGTRVLVRSILLLPKTERARFHACLCVQACVRVHMAVCPRACIYMPARWNLRERARARVRKCVARAHALVFAHVALTNKRLYGILGRCDIACREPEPLAHVSAAQSELAVCDTGAGWVLRDLNATRYGLGKGVGSTRTHCPLRTARVLRLG